MKHSAGLVDLSRSTLNFTNLFDLYSDVYVAVSSLEQGLEEMKKMLLLLLGCAVQVRVHLIPRSTLSHIHFREKTTVMFSFPL